MLINMSANAGAGIISKIGNARLRYLLIGAAVTGLLVGAIIYFVQPQDSATTTQQPNKVTQPSDVATPDQIRENMVPRYKELLESGDLKQYQLQLLSLASQYKAAGDVEGQREVYEQIKTNVPVDKMAIATLTHLFIFAESQRNQADIRRFGVPLVDALNNAQRTEEAKGISNRLKEVSS